ncbi:hypothetical protein E8E15_001824 [Penicillium rubens]|uniref:Pc13g00980 protein n=1 Tax=Penicillium rubens (strain ATCC 28089 / DSM 1075 / NRRL 1951 / Wisconsin 54-1255) TaxID=500485 RepID=B6H1A4_PENRW|nr:hypothetical protein E8E15_001824 [Penicillium rubens]CAP91167.1 Pc13g00980 [Penicillium rubens Wisconsin 54-1255]
MSLRQIYPPFGENPSGQATIDIIAVHGLDFIDMSGRCSVSSWREPLDESGEFWPVAFIRAHGLRARLLLYEFDSVMTFGAAPESVSREADGLLHQISTIRPTDHPDAPIIFLSHGLGGILVKQALVNASQGDRYCGINNATRGLAFFGTPHQAPSHRSPGVIETVFSLVSPRIPIRSPYSPELPIVQGFRDQVEDYQFISFYGDSDEAVPFSSAVMNLAGNRETQVRLSSNHEDLCRFYQGSDNYRKIANFSDLWTASPANFASTGEYSPDQSVSVLPNRL